MNITKPEILHLIGNHEENFYVLGQNDREAFFALAKKLSEVPVPEFDLPQDSLYLSSLSSYADGLNTSAEEVLDLYAKLEFLGTTNLLPECNPILPFSKIHVKNQNEKTHVHAEFISSILGLSLFEPQIILCDFTNTKKVLLFSWKGLAMFNLMGLNEDNLFINLHQQYGPIFDNPGRLITPHLFEMLFKFSHTQHIKNAFKNFASQRSWGLTAVDQHNNLLRLDLCGSQIEIRLLDLNTSQNFEFHERPLKSRATIDSEPFLHRGENKSIFDYHFGPNYQYKLNLTEHKIEYQNLLLENKTIFITPFITPRDSREMPVMVEASRKHVLLAQNFSSNHDWERAFHHLQMSLASGIPLPSHQFVLIFWQFIKLKNKKEWGYLYQELLQLKNIISLPTKDLVLFTLYLMEMRLDLPHLNHLDHIQNKEIIELLIRLNLMNKKEQQDFISKLHLRLDFLDFFPPSNYTKLDK